MISATATTISPITFHMSCWGSGIAAIVRSRALASAVLVWSRPRPSRTRYGTATSPKAATATPAEITSRISPAAIAAASSATAPSTISDRLVR